MILTYGEDDEYFSMAKTYDMVSGKVGLVKGDQCFKKMLHEDNSVSPDGTKKLLEPSWEDKIEGNRYVANVDGSNQTQLPEMVGNAPDPQWLADGSIVYVSMEWILSVLTPDEVIVEIGEYENFVVRPFDKGVGLKSSNMVILDQGKMVFYDY